MRIGELAAAAGLPARTIRFYEHRGLLPEPTRTPNGYRTYDESALTRLRFIRTAQAAGLSLAEIGGVLCVRDAGTAPCAHVAELLRAKLDDVTERRRELDATEHDLTALLRRSRDLDPADCGSDAVCHILEAGVSADSAPPRRRAARS